MTEEHSLVVELGTALALLAISIVIAGESDAAGNLMLAIWGTLVVLFAIHHFTE